jgi:hypothetical protein
VIPFSGVKQRISVVVPCMKMQRQDTRLRAHRAARRESPAGARLAAVHRAQHVGLRSKPLAISYPAAIYPTEAFTNALA